MISAYNEIWVYNLELVKEAKRWWKHGYINQEQFNAIQQSYQAPFYHPNFTIRVLLFIATLFASSGITGFFTILVAEAGTDFISLACIVYGIVSFFVLEKTFIAKVHFKSGVTEAILYHSCGFVIGGIAGLTDFNNIHVILLTCLIVFTFAAVRYLDLLCTIVAILVLAGMLFFEFYSAGGIFEKIIPFVFMIFFAALYFMVKTLQRKEQIKIWRNNLLIIEFISLLLIYLAGNYLVVRELSEAMLGLSLQAGADIPFALIFYLLTVLIPFAYLYFGIKKKDKLMLRVSLLVIAFSAFTFKYYFSLGHPEITLTIAGIILIAIAIGLMRYLKIMRNGFTRENLLSEKWGSMNVQAFIISQTMGGNQPTVDQPSAPGGGNFGGGGSTNDF